MFRDILKESFFQLFIIYLILVVLLQIGIIDNFFFAFNSFALVLGILGSIIFKKQKEKIVFPKYTLHFLLALIFIIHMIPYIGNSVPLGYDPGIYKYTFENYPEGLKTFPPVLPILIKPIIWLFGDYFVFTWFFSFLFVFLGYTVFLVGKKYFSENAGLIALSFFMVSMTQFKMFEMNYYKNVLALIFIFLAIYFYDLNSKRNMFFFVLFSALGGGTHRPTFLIFGLSYLFFSFLFLIYKKDRLKNFINHIVMGISIIFLVFIFYFQKLKIALLPSIIQVASGNVSAGVFFINLFTYQFWNLIYLPFSIIGIVFIIKQKKITIPLIWFFVTFFIIYFRLFFENRNLIPFDLMTLVFAGYGFSVLINENKKFFLAGLIILLLSGTYFIGNTAFDAKPLISDQELDKIRSLQDLPEDAYVMCTDSYYSPWIRGYSGHDTIAPGMFEHDKWSRQEWNMFIRGENLTELFSRYERDVYIYIGDRRYHELNECFVQEGLVFTFNASCDRNEMIIS